MFFQISPARKSNDINNDNRKRNRLEEEELARCEVLTLTPFTANPKIVFHDVHVGATHIRKLLIKNPNNVDIKLFAKMAIPEEINLLLNWNVTEIKKGEEAILEFSWCPSTEEASKYNLVISDGKRINREVPVILKSFLPKKKMKLTQSKSSVPKAKVKTSSATISTKNRKNPNSSKCQSNANKCEENKENFTYISNYSYCQKPSTFLNDAATTPHFVSPSKMNFSVDQIGEYTGRATYIVSDKCYQEEYMRETYVANRDNNIPVLDIQDEENISSIFRDSLEKRNSVYSTPPSTSEISLLDQRCQISKVNQNCNSTPTLEYLLNKKWRGPFPLQNDETRKGFSKYFISEEKDLKNYFLENDKAAYSNDNLITSETYTIKKRLKDNSRNFSTDESHLSSDISPSVFIAEKPVFHFKPPPLNEMRNELSSINESTSASNNTFIFHPLSSDKSLRKTKNYYCWNCTPKQYTKCRNQQQNDCLEKGKHESLPKAEASICQKKRLPAPLITLVQDNDSFEFEEIYFKNWLNSFLTLPKEFDLKAGLGFTSMTAETSTKTTINQHVQSNKLDLFRKRAKEFYCSKQIKDIRKTIHNLIEPEKISIRSDKDLHLNLQLKEKFLKLMLSYNPLWLRIGLEIIYDTIIPLRSASDTMGLENFISDKLLKNYDLLKKYKTVYSSQYTFYLKKTILKKFLIFVYFLDHAKNAKLIKNDPCLFCKNAKIKDSLSILTYFTREYLAAVGNIEKFLKKHNYTVTHVQSYLHEFDYSVKNIYANLRDGIRLAKLIETIQMRGDLMDKLRVPAISRLQKVYNVQLVLDALNECGFIFQCDIEAKDIVDGDGDKTRLFLSELINITRSRLMISSATVIQRWFRSIPIKGKRQELNERWESARKIQIWYKHQRLAKFYFAVVKLLKPFIEERRKHLMAQKIQCYFRMIFERKKYLKQSRLIVKLQARCRGSIIRTYYKKKRAAIIMQVAFQTYVTRKRFLKLKSVIIFVQNRFRMKMARKSYLLNKKSCRKIQAYYRMYVARKHFLILKNACITIQKSYLAQRLMKLQYSKYDTYRKTVILIQQKWRAIKLGKEARQKLVVVRQSVAVIENRYLAKKRRMEYVKMKQSCLVIQHWYRSIIVMRKSRTSFLIMKTTAVRLEQNFVGKKIRRDYLQLKLTTVKIQLKFRAVVNGRIEYLNFHEKKNAAITLQRRFRAQQLMCKRRKEYEALKHGVVFIQRKFKAISEMRTRRNDYLQLKAATIELQQRFKAIVIGKRICNHYQNIRNATICLQQKFRARNVMLTQKKEYDNLKNATITIQKLYRANMLCKKYRAYYKSLRNTTIKIQCQFRRRLEMIKQRTQYNTLKTAAIVIQKLYKMKFARRKYLRLKTVAIMVQERFRANILCKKYRAYYESLRNATIKIQCQFRRRLEMIKQRTQYNTLKTAAIVIQKLYKMKLARKKYLRLKTAAILVQERFRANILCKKYRASYEALRNATIKIQCQIRRRQQMIKQRTEFNAIKKAAITIQKQYKMKLVQKKYIKLKAAAITIQGHLRANKSMIKQLDNYKKLRKATLFIQCRFKANLAMRKEKMEFVNKRKTIVNFQKYAKGYLIRKHYTGDAIELIKTVNFQNRAVTIIQAFWRGYLLRKSNNLEITALKNKKKQLALSETTNPLKKQLSDTKTLEERCNIAISSILNQHSSYQVIVKALEDFDFITKHSPVLCMRMSLILPSQLYIILTSTARSRPDMVACNFCALILINFYKYSETRLNSWNPEYLDGLLNVLLNWCDKEAPLFSTLATLFWLFAHEQEWKRIILLTPNIYQRLQKIHMLVTRKHGMVMKTMKKQQQSISALLFNPSCLNPIQSKVPRTNTTWGLDYNRPYTYQNAVLACDNLIEILDICENTQ